MSDFLEQVIAERRADVAEARTRVDDAAMRVLRAKEASGLLPCG